MTYYSATICPSTDWICYLVIEGLRLLRAPVDDMSFDAFNILKGFDLWVIYLLYTETIYTIKFFISFLYNPIDLTTFFAVYDFSKKIYSLYLTISKDQWFLIIELWEQNILMTFLYFPLEFLRGCYMYFTDPYLTLEKMLLLSPVTLKSVQWFINYFFIQPEDLPGLSHFLQTRFTKNILFSIFPISGLFFGLTVFASFWWINALGLYGSFILTTVGLALFWISCLITTFLVWTNNYSYYQDYGKWFTIGPSTDVHIDFNFDTLSMAFSLLVLSIAFFINLYTFAYFRYEPNVSRLLLFIDIFVVSMVVLVTAGNLVLMYLGWEMIGITSFFLINFWATRMGTVKASYKAFTFNKISDCCILLAILLIHQMNQSVNINQFNETICTYAQTDLNLLHQKLPAINSLTYLFMIAAFIKSAQFGFHIWLPDSMEAPVPASALIHSATLVSAGIFLILRLYPLFEFSPFARTYIIFFGSLTALFGGVCSIFQTDVKRLLAYSTISHCGVLMFLTYFKNPDLTIIYLYVHGFFKAIIFMCMGHVIRFANNYQDMRRMGGFYKYLPFEALMSLVALLNLGGVAFTWGYYMKHFLLLDGTPESEFNLFCFVMVVIGSLCGLIYSFKLYYYVFFDFKKARKHVYYKILNNSNNNIFYTNASLASNIAISGLAVVAYFLCGYLIFKYLDDYAIHFDISFFSNSKNDLKITSTEFFLNFFYYLNWIITFLITFLVFNNWKNTIDPAFKIKFFVFAWTYVFFFYLFYTILSF
jgi:NADH:ubiquinone oxidoreductase subunit 5 (subunit L)/multisubunit Na+/H+ antiporter MnhA subunit